MELCKKHLNVVLSFNFNGSEIAGFACKACKLEEDMSVLDKELEDLNQKIVQIVETPSPMPELECKNRELDSANRELRKILDQQSDEILELRERVKSSAEEIDMLNAGNAYPDANNTFKETIRLQREKIKILEDEKHEMFKSALLKMHERIGRKIDNDMMVEIRKYGEEEEGMGKFFDEIKSGEDGLPETVRCDKHPGADQELRADDGKWHCMMCKNLEQQKLELIKFNPRDEAVQVIKSIVPDLTEMVDKIIDAASGNLSKLAIKPEDTNETT